MLQIYDKARIPPVSKKQSFSQKYSQALAIIKDDCYNVSMSMSLEVMKNLRSKGASIQMQEDLASFLQNDEYNNGYDNPLFLPTIDFILLIKNQVKSQEQELEQGQSVDLSNFDIPKVYDPSYFDKISLKATGEIIKAADIASHTKDSILAYLDYMDIQRAKHMGLIGEQGQQIASPEQNISRRANISTAKRKDRGTTTIKSMFESLVSGLNALQVRVTAANAANAKRHQDSVQHSQSIKDIIQQQLRNAFKRSNKINTEDKIAKASRRFLKDMRKALRPNKKNEEGSNEGDNQLGRIKINPKDVFDQKRKNLDSIQREEEQAKHTSDMMQILASKAIDATKRDDRAGKEGDDDKSLQANRNNRTKEVQNRIQQRNRLRRNFMIDDAHHSHMTDEMKHRAESEKRVDDMTAEKAVKQLQSLGVSLGEAHDKIHNKELDALAKTQDKQRGS